MRHHTRFCALALVALFLAISADSNRALAQPPPPIQAGQVIISELRLRGPTGVEDEFVELYNNTDQSIVVQPLDNSSGWTVVISNGQITGPLFTIPSGTFIPARGHLLGGNVNGYSLCNYPSGYGTIIAVTRPAGPCLVNGLNGTFTHTTPDRTWDFDVPDGTGVALFATTNGTNFTASTRLDSVGFTNSPALFREGNGIPSVVTLGLEHTYYRDLRNGTPRDTGDNATDFVLVGTSTGIQVTQLGAPGPENLTSPIVNNTTIVPTLADPSVSSSSSPNRERSLTPETNANLGTLLIRRRITNSTGLPISRLRFRIVNITTLGTPASDCPVSSCADLRALTSQDGTANVGGSVAQVRGLRLEEPPEQPAGGGYNASLSDDEITLSTPLAPAQSIIVVFKLGVMRGGPYRFFVNIEAQNNASLVFVNPASPSVGTNGGTGLNRKRLIVETVRGASRTTPTPARPATAPPLNTYVPLVINLTPPAEDKDGDDDESKEEKEKETPPAAKSARRGKQ